MVFHRRGFIRAAKVSMDRPDSFLDEVGRSALLVKLIRQHDDDVVEGDDPSG